VTDAHGRLLGVLTRRDILDHALSGRELPIHSILLTDPIVAHPDETLREVANRMARHDITRMPVVTRGQPAELVGLITLPQLLQARLRDLHEAHVSERVLRLRLRRSRLLPSDNGVRNRVSVRLGAGFADAARAQLDDGTASSPAAQRASAGVSSSRSQHTER
jgi:CBS-domain-containing membrane protein